MVVVDVFLGHTKRQTPLQHLPPTEPRQRGQHAAREEERRVPWELLLIPAAPAALEAVTLTVELVAVARVDPAALAKMAATVLLPLVPAAAAAAVPVDQRLLLAQTEQPALAVLVVQGGLQALGVLELHPV